MEKVRINNDLLVKYTVFRDGQPESFVGATDITVTVTNEAYKKAIPNTFDVVGNIVNISIDAADFNLCGKYRVTLKYVRGNDIEIDALAFEGVQYTSLTGGTEIVGVEVVTVNISGDIGIAIPDNNKIDLDGLNSNIDKLHFKPDTLVQLAEIGDVRYSTESKTLEVKVSDTVSIQLGQEMHTRVKNDESIQINNGQMVYINSAAGANPLAKIASTSNADVAQKTFGMATENIPANGFGAITTEGLVRDINTSAFPEGSMLWLGTNGNVTNIEPTAPTSKISVGMVLRSNANNGVVYVKIRAIARNQKLSDVYAPTLTGGDVLRWNNTTLRFETFNITSALSNKVDTSRTITAGNGLTGGGSLTEDRTININPADDSLTVTADNVKVNTNNTLTSTSTTQPLSANQGKVLNEKVVQVETNLNKLAIIDISTKTTKKYSNLVQALIDFGIYFSDTIPTYISFDHNTNQSKSIYRYIGGSTSEPHNYEHVAGEIEVYAKRTVDPYIDPQNTTRQIAEFELFDSGYTEEFYFLTPTGGNLSRYTDGTKTIDVYGRINSKYPYANVSSIKILKNTKSVYVRTLSYPIQYLYKKTKTKYKPETLNLINVDDIKKGIMYSNMPPFDSISQVDAIASNYIEVEPNQTYVYQTNTITGSWARGMRVIYLDENGVFISLQEFTVSEGIKYIDGFSGFTINTPTGCKKILMNLANWQLASVNDTFILVKYNNLKQYLYSDINLIKHNETKDVSIWVLGDSITASGYGAIESLPNKVGALGGWIRTFIKDVRPTKWYNYSAGGHTLTSTSYSWEGDTLTVLDDSFIKKLEQAIADFNSGIIQEPDYLLICGCTNDFDKSIKRYVTESEIESSGLTRLEYIERNFYTTEGGYGQYRLVDIKNVNLGKIYGAVRYIIQRVGTIFKNCKFIIITPPQSAKHTVVNQVMCVDEMLASARRLSVPVINVWAESNMPMLWDYIQPDGSEPHRFLSDGVHTFDNPVTGVYVDGDEYQGKYISKYFNKMLE